LLMLQGFRVRNIYGFCAYSNRRNLINKNVKTQSLVKALCTIKFKLFRGCIKLDENKKERKFSSKVAI